MPKHHTGETSQSLIPRAFVLFETLGTFECCVDLEIWFPARLPVLAAETQWDVPNQEVLGLNRTMDIPNPEV